MKSKSGKVKSYIEILISYIVAIITSFLAFKIVPESVFIAKLDTLITLVVTITITLTGFLITSITILISLLNSKVVAKIRNRDMWKRLVYCYFEPIVFGSISLLVYLFITTMTGADNIISKMNVVVLVFLSTLFVVGLVRVAYFQYLILKIIPNEESDIVYDPTVVIESSEDDAFTNKDNN